MSKRVLKCQIGPWHKQHSRETRLVERLRPTPGRPSDPERLQLSFVHRTQSTKAPKPQSPKEAQQTALQPHRDLSSVIRHPSSATIIFPGRTGCTPVPGFSYRRSFSWARAPAYSRTSTSLSAISWRPHSSPLPCTEQATVWARAECSLFLPSALFHHCILFPARPLQLRLSRRYEPPSPQPYAVPSTVQPLPCTLPPELPHCSYLYTQTRTNFHA